MKAKNLSIDIIKELYDVDTSKGELIRKVDMCSGKHKAGTVAGGRRKDGYVNVQIDGIYYYLHRIIYAVHHNVILGPDDVINHLNHDPSDNRIANLSCGPQQDNMQQKQSHTNQPYGVCEYHEAGKDKWCATIQSTKTHPERFGKAGFPTMKDAYEVVRREHLRIRGSYPVNDAYWKALWNLP